MIEPAIGPGHDRGDLDAGAIQCAPIGTDVAGDDGCGPGRIDEFVGELDAFDANVAGDGFDQIVRLGEPVDQRIGVEREGEAHDAARA